MPKNTFIVIVTMRGVNARLGYNAVRAASGLIRLRLAQNPVIRPLTMRHAHRQAMIEHVRRLWPEEACGLLAGAGRQVEQVYLIENIQHSRTAYFMDPTQQVRVMLAIEAAGWEVCSIFHSHPAGPPQPSATDIDRAYYPDAVYIILAPDPGQEWAMRGFEIDQGRVLEIPIEITA